MKKIISISLLLGLLLFAPINVLAGTASGSAEAKGGEDCAKISKKDRQNTGAMEVNTVTVNGTPLTLGTDYTVENNNSTRPVIKFKNPLTAKANVEVTLKTGKPGTFDAVVTLTNCR